MYSYALVIRLSGIRVADFSRILLVTVTRLDNVSCSNPLCSMGKTEVLEVGTHNPHTFSLLTNTKLVQLWSRLSWIAQAWSAMF